MIRISITVLVIILFGCGSRQDVLQKTQDTAITNISIPGNPFEVILKDERFSNVKIQQLNIKSLSNKWISNELTIWGEIPNDIHKTCVEFHLVLIDDKWEIKEFQNTVSCHD